MAQDENIVIMEFEGDEFSSRTFTIEIDKTKIQSMTGLELWEIFCEQTGRINKNVGYKRIRGYTFDKVIKLDKTLSEQGINAETIAGNRFTITDTQSSCGGGYCKV